MKRETAIATAMSALLVAGIVTWAGQAAKAQVREEKKQERTIKTSGEGTIRVHPDHARVFFGVQTFASTVKQARAQNATQIKQVTTALTALKIPNLKMKSTNLTVELIQVEGDGRVPKLAGYRVTNSLTALVESSETDNLGTLAGRVLDAALENGANLVQQVVFFKEDDKEAKRQALIKAVQNARANADALATGADRRVSDVINIDGQPEYGFRGQTQMLNSIQSDGGAGASTSLMPGEQEITCSVTITCTY